jgi:hypothetical protein
VAGESIHLSGGDVLLGAHLKRFHQVRGSSGGLVLLVRVALERALGRLDSAHASLAEAEALATSLNAGPEGNLDQMLAEARRGPRSPLTGLEPQLAGPLACQPRLPERSSQLKRSSACVTAARLTPSPRASAARLG